MHYAVVWYNHSIGNEGAYSMATQEDFPLLRKFLRVAFFARSSMCIPCCINPHHPNLTVWGNHIEEALKKIVLPESTTTNYLLIVAKQVVEHTTVEYLHTFQDRPIEGRHTCVLTEMEHFCERSDHALTYRVSHTSGDLTTFARGDRACREESIRRRYGVVGGSC